MSGADLAGQALRAGPLDRLEVLLVPVIVREGPHALPDGARHEALPARAPDVPCRLVHLAHAVGGDL